MADWIQNKQPYGVGQEIFRQGQPPRVRSRVFSRQHGFVEIGRDHVELDGSRSQKLSSSWRRRSEDQANHLEIFDMQFEHRLTDLII